MDPLLAFFLGTLIGGLAGTVVTAAGAFTYGARWLGKLAREAFGDM